MCACLFATSLLNCGSIEDNATRRGAWISNAFLCFPFKQLMIEKPASHRYVDGNGSSVLIAMPLSLGYSAFILIQKLAREFDSKEFRKPSSADSSNNLSFKSTLIFNSSTFTVGANGFRIHSFPLCGSFCSGK